MALRAFGLFGSTLSLVGVSRIGSTMSLVDVAAFGASMALRSVSRLGSSMALFGFLNMGASLSIRSFARLASNLAIQGKLQFSAANTYINYDTANSAVRAYVSGSKSMSLTASGGTLHGTWSADTVVTVSDRRLKSNIRQLSRTLSESPVGATNTSDLQASWILRQLRPVSYNFKKGSDVKHVRFGFIADEMEKVLPQIVRELPNQKETSDPKKGIVYTDLIAVLTGAVKEFNALMTAMSSRVAAAENELSRLDSVDPVDVNVV